MGSKRQEWISSESAADELGLDIASIEHLANDNFLRKLTVGNQLYIHRSDVERIRQLRKAAEVDPEELTRRVLILENIVERLTDSVNLLYEANGMHATRFEDIDDGDLIFLRENVAQELDHDSWPIDRLLSCCEVFLRLSELEVERLNKITNDNHAWRPFYELCLKQSRYVTEHPKFDVDIELQRCRDLLSQGRQNLRSIATIFIELSHQDSPSHELIAAVAAADMDMFDTLVKQLKAKTGTGSLELL